VRSRDYSLRLARRGCCLSKRIISRGLVVPWKRFSLSVHYRRFIHDLRASRATASSAIHADLCERECSFIERCLQPLNRCCTFVLCACSNILPTRFDEILLTRHARYMHENCSSRFASSFQIGKSEALLSARFLRAFCDFSQPRKERESENGRLSDIDYIYRDSIVDSTGIRRISRESCSSSRSQLTSVQETTLSSARRRRATCERTPRDHYKYSHTVCAGNTDRSISVVKSEVITRQRKQSGKFLSQLCRVLKLKISSAIRCYEAESNWTSKITDWTRQTGSIHCT